MTIRSLRILNYKSFRATTEILLTPGFNVVVGKNNAGKSALIETLIRPVRKMPHRRLGANRSSVEPTVEIAFSLSASDLADEVVRLGTVHLPVPLDSRKQFADYAREHVEHLATVKEHVVRCSYQSKDIVHAQFDAYPESGQHCLAVRWDMSANAFIVDGNGFTSLTDTNRLLGWQLSHALLRRVYVFKAERVVSGRGAITSSPSLAPNASNLPGVLHLLQSGNPSRFSRLVRYFREVFPDLYGITTPPVQNSNDVEVRLWNIDTSTERDDLAIPLQESGTGVGQVLAMLYVIATSDEPHVIAIDEPQSFLHPAAIRQLLSIFQAHSQHQYILATHSPEVISTSGATELIVIRKEKGESRVSLIDATAYGEIRDVLAELGVRLSDVFGADNVLWVEGDTEKVCFPEILNAQKKKMPPGTAIVSVRSTGDFEGRHAALVLDIYERLASGAGIMPPALAFVFDRENKSPQQQQDLERMSDGRVKFLPRRMYENYLLHPVAISSLMNGLDNFRDTPVLPEEVTEWIEERRCSREYYAPGVTIDGTAWKVEVNGAALLRDLFAAFSESRHQYDKVKHGVALTAAICRNAFEEIEEVAQLISKVLSKEVP